ncbi:MAG TPA: gliding motility protein GldC [Saprospiraceae bacterium]|nr:gliding motility protein GldC [Saprospiraceae bacterium]MBK7699723.1 gliding motility protein GldC [Saprospiraceae bacterium]HQV65959.1 gliding motility protein GldC [Saprospiraceae bacterium]HQV97362.1 gliding motility protein GldC [Saprospiraceae bacterium]
MSKPVVKKSLIEIEIGLNEDKMPETIQWRSDDNPNGKDFTECKAISLALFDKDYKDTLKIDLWTTEMQVIEMDRFMYQTLRSLADTYFRATNNQQLANDMQLFVDYFGKQTGIISPETENQA